MRPNHLGHLWQHPLSVFACLPKLTNVYTSPFCDLCVDYKRVNLTGKFLACVARSPSAADSSHDIKEKRSLPARQLLVGYWGQNSIGTRISRPYWEKDLRYFCNNHKFDIYLVAFVHRLFRNNRNRGIAMNQDKV